MHNFWLALQNVGIHDLGFSGNTFTWCNNQDSSTTVRERLDRACGNPRWMQLLPEALIQHLDSAFSDQAPILISTITPL
ncbi:UNVERIFIED_CONTAM: hypothetical protein Sangu_2604300, partial [Sesamum angustifolium]